VVPVRCPGQAAVQAVAKDTDVVANEQPFFAPMSGPVPTAVLWLDTAKLFACRARNADVLVNIENRI